MADFTSILNIIFIISGGVLTFVVLFIFAKRQIYRFALRSRRGPHVPIGADGKKCLKKEIERRIEAVPRIMHEPRLLSAEPSHYILQPQQPYHYRFRAVDDVKTLGTSVSQTIHASRSFINMYQSSQPLETQQIGASDVELRRNEPAQPIPLETEEEIARQDPCLRRHPGDSLRAFLLTSLAAPLDGSGQKLVHQFCDTYEYARHHPGEFAEDEYLAYTRLLLKLLDAARLLQSVCVGRASPRSSPARRGARLLDAARLRPPMSALSTLPALSALPGHNKLPHKHYTALENMPVEAKLEEEMIRVPSQERRAPDETAV